MDMVPRSFAPWNADKVLKVRYIRLAWRFDAPDRNLKVYKRSGRIVVETLDSICHCDMDLLYNPFASGSNDPTSDISKSVYL